MRMLKYRFTKSKIFTLAYILYIFNAVLSESNYDQFSALNNLLFVMRMGLLAVFAAICFSYEENVKKLVCMLIFLLVVVSNVILADGALGPLIMLFIAWASKCQNLKSIFKTTIVAFISCYVFVYISYLLGIVEGYSSIRELNVLGFEGTYTRNSLGFKHSNQIPTLLYIVFAIFIIYKQKYLKVTHVIAFVILNILIYLQCNSRISFLLTFMAIALYYTIKGMCATKHMSMGQRLFDFCMHYSFPICAFTSLIAGILYNTSSFVWIVMNYILNNRLELTNKAIGYYGINVLGSGKTVGQSASLAGIVVDNGYIACLLQYGVVISLIVLVSLFLVSNIAKRNENTYILLAIFVIALGNLVDMTIMSYKCIPLFCIIFHTKDPLLYDGVKSSAVVP